ncbi:MAG: cytochrome c [Proteobacteria bacterium]|nr:cytochrome c [Pseudomonadota bacterium]
MSTVSSVRNTVFGLLLGLLSAGFTIPSLAQTGSSIPYFEVDTLTIPRIDVEGYGSLRLSLLLVDEATLTFSVSAAVDADVGATPGATYDLQTAVLDIPLVQADFDFYALQLQLIPGDLFQVIVADDAIVTGQDEYNQQCSSCHGIEGQGGIVAVSLVNCANCGSEDVLTTYISNVMPLGAASSCSGDCASDVADYVLTIFQVDNSPMVTQTIEAIQSMPLDDTLRKASLQLVGRLPSESELQLVADSGETGLRTVLDGMMEEDAFYARLSEIFNDLILTNRYLSANGPIEQAINLMRPFPNARWFDPGEGLRDENFQFNRITTNNSVASEPLQLINYVVKNKLPMTEVITADYFMVNGYSAKSYGVDDQLAFNDEWDAGEWLPAQVAGIPHAGLFTSLMFLNRYPTSDTNVNRGRSRVVYDLFLDVDILALDGTRPDGEAVDISSPAPTMENEDCVVCHALLDPVASSFQNWNDRGFYRPNRPWYEDMFQAGFAGVDRPENEQPTSLQWLSGEMAKDPRFNDAMVRIIYFGLTGQEPLNPPGESATDADNDAYAAESVHLDELKAVYVADNQNLKTLIKEIILSPYWRAEGLESDAFAIIHEQTGAARLLTPELLHRKIDAVLGFEWRGFLDNYAVNKDIPFAARLLDNRFFYNQIYGGIDSFVVTSRLTEPNGLMVYVQERMANELACYAVPNDFLADADQRLLFPYVEADNQAISAQDQADIKTNIQHLHAHLLGETLAIDDAEVQITYDLFTTVLASGQANIGISEDANLPVRCRRSVDLETGDALATSLSQDPDYVLRAWMAVAAYLMSDYRFVYE